VSQPFWRTQTPAIGVALLDVFAIGLGGGTPLFAVPLGLPIGWWLARRQPVAEEQQDIPWRVRLRSLAGAAAALAGLTFVVLLAIWGAYARTATVEQLVLTLAVAPLLQFAAVLAGGMAGMAMRRRAGRDRG